MVWLIVAIASAQTVLPTDVDLSLLEGWPLPMIEALGRAWDVVGPAPVKAGACVVVQVGEVGETWSIALTHANPGYPSRSEVAWTARLASDEPVVFETMSWDGGLSIHTVDRVVTERAEREATARRIRIHEEGDYAWGEEETRTLRRLDRAGRVVMEAVWHRGDGFVTRVHTTQVWDERGLPVRRKVVRKQADTQRCVTTWTRHSTFKADVVEMCDGEETGRGWLVWDADGRPGHRLLERGEGDGHYVEEELQWSWGEGRLSGVHRMAPFVGHQDTTWARGPDAQLRIESLVGDGHRQLTLYGATCLPADPAPTFW